MQEGLRHALQYGLWLTTQPYQRWVLKRKGAKFVRGYSEEGDALLVASPRYGDAAPRIPVHDRPYEYAFTVSKFLEYEWKDLSVLDVGSSGSVLPPILAALGNEVWCVDVRDWPINWPRVHFVLGELHRADLPSTHFDVVTCISTLEHIGLGRYGDTEDPQGDIRTAELMAHYVKPSGFMILTVPYGRATVCFPAHRVYNRRRLNRIMAGFNVLDAQFFGPIDEPSVYRPCTEEEAIAVDTSREYAIVCYLLKKT